MPERLLGATGFAETFQTFSHQRGDRSQRRSTQTHHCPGDQNDGGDAHEHDDNRLGEDGHGDHGDDPHANDPAEIVQSLPGLNWHRLLGCCTLHLESAAVAPDHVEWRILAPSLTVPI